MLDKVRLKCNYCEGTTFYSVPFIEGQIKAMKIHKSQEVAQQMHEKRGPFYDKWLAAMEKRGEQMRCQTCLTFHPDDPTLFSNYCTYWLKRVSPSQFACSSYVQYDRI